MAKHKNGRPNTDSGTVSTDPNIMEVVAACAIHPASLIEWDTKALTSGYDDMIMLGATCKACNTRMDTLAMPYGTQNHETSEPEKIDFTK
ncbi:MAG TPA: hypothetical protein VN922_01420 [Bacteroidia bacterium]|nr:hypothetical protein [Bacteroidia bacterium]